MHLQHVQYMMSACQKKKKCMQGIVFRRGLAKLEVFNVARAGDQLLRLFAERIEFLSLVQILY